MQTRLRLVLVLAVVGCVLTLVSAFLPWTWNSAKGGSAGITQMWGLYAVVLVLQALTVALISSRRSDWALVPAILAGVSVVTTMVLTPRGIMMWDGQDKFGRPTGGMEVTTLGYGAAVALLGALVVVACSLLALLAVVRSPQRRGRREPGRPGERPHDGAAQLPSAGGAGGRPQPPGAAGRSPR